MNTEETACMVLFRENEKRKRCGEIRRLLEDIAYTNEVELAEVYHNRQEHLLHALFCKVAELGERTEQILKENEEYRKELAVVRAHFDVPPNRRIAAIRYE